MRGVLNPVAATDSPIALAGRPLVFRTCGVSKVYPTGEGDVAVLRDLNLEVTEGELVVLLGPSGSGKSTLLNILGGLDSPTSGKVFFRDRELTAADDAELTLYRRRNVGFVFQFYNLIPTLTAQENVALITDIAAAPMKPRDALALVDMSHRLDHFPSQLSGGEQQRVAIARAIAKRPDLLLCDEPTGALDVNTGRVVLAAIQNVNAELGTTTVLITHNVVIGAMGDRVIRLSAGQVAGISTNAARAPASSLDW
jgi:putative ABC transport system ATP-binding protein